MRHSFLPFFSGVTTAVVLLAVPAGAQAEKPVQQGAETLQLDHYDVSPPLRDMRPIPPDWVEIGKNDHPVKPLPHHHDAKALAPLRDAVVQSLTGGPLVSATAGVNVDGVGVPNLTITGAPPDTNGAVGSTQYVQWVNTAFAVFDKATGNRVFGPVNGNTLWQGFGGRCETDNDGDPIAIYDKLANRWVMTQFSVSASPFFECIAVSQTADATGAYNRYAFTYTDFNDYPKVGVWPDAYYISYNMFNAAGTAFLGSKVCAFDRAKMLLGQVATQQCFQLSPTFGGLLPADLDGTTPPPAGAPNYVVAFDDVGRNGLNLWKFHVDWSNSTASTFTGPTKITTAAFTEACNGGTCITQAGTTQRLDSLADRLMYRLAYRNFGTSESLVLNHSVDVAGRSGVRWYEIRNPGGTPTVFQQSTFSPDTNHRWMGSIAQDRAGNMLLGYSTSGAVRPSVRVTGRLATDPINTMQTETEAFAGTGSQTANLSRWGDYSAMTVDPVDDCTFWFTTEYLKANGTFNWSTRIASFRFASCGGPRAPDFGVAASPATVNVVQGSSSAATVTVSSLADFSSAVTLSATGVPAGVTASFSANPVTPAANGSINSTLAFTAAPTATPGAFTVTITGTSGALTHATSVTLNVTTAGGPVTVFSDGAESATTTLTFSNTTTSTVWRRQNTSPFAGAWRWRCGGATANNNYGNNGDARMTTPGLDLTGATRASLSYAFKHSTETSWDFFEVRVSTDNGATWTNLVRVSGRSAAWSNYNTASLSLASFVGRTNVKIQFRLTTDVSVTDFGLGIDEIKVVKQ